MNLAVHPTRALIALAILFCVLTAHGESNEEQFRFVRPVHVVQNKRTAKRMPPMDVTTFRPGAQAPLADPPEVALGERLFTDTRFSQFFAANYDGNVNHPLKQGEPLLDNVNLGDKQVRGPFKSRAINCRSCHFVAEFTRYGNDQTRTYADFVQRSPVPVRDDGRQTTPRNSMSMVDSFIPRDGATLLHSDGEFASVAALVKSTMTGRNFGWLPNERDKAIAHIARVIREDDGSDAISYRYGGSYAQIFASTDPGIHFSFKLPREYRLNVASATDQQIFDAVARLLSVYLESLAFARDNDNIHDGSPYDMFLKLNGLPQKPGPGETDLQYTARLRKAVAALKEPKFVDEEKQMTWFYYHKQKFNFGPEELEGLKIFLRTQDSEESSRNNPNPAALLVFPGALVLLGFASRRSKYRDGVLLTSTVVIVCSTVFFGGWTRDTGKTKKAAQKEAASVAPTAHVANCTTCHTPPDFTDRKFHNNGAAQEEYDSAHGTGSFAKLKIPSYQERSRNHDKFLPATPQHPRATEVFRSPASESEPAAVDLGMWNVFANPDYPDPQPHLRKLLCGQAKCDPQQVLPRTIALFRTPPLRDLEDSNPFMHTGRFASVEDVLRYYIRFSDLARRGKLRNGAPELSSITLDEEDIKPLAAFLRSLNEDYD